MSDSTDPAAAEREPTQGTADAMEPCPVCSMQIRRSEMDIHLGHAHNRSRDGKKSSRKPSRSRDR
jgi:hypothetical protein